MLTFDNPVLMSRDLSLWYGDNQALNRINMEIPAREVTAIIGPSGCGKSTFLKTINRMTDLVEGVRLEGALEFLGRPLKDYDVVELRRRVGMVFQRPNPFPKSIYENIVFGQPEINLGIIPGFGGTQRLPRIIGPAKAKEWILTGRRYSAEEAHEVGLVSRVVEPDHLLAETKAFAEELVTKSGPILALAKRAINSSVGMGGEDIPLEANLFGQCFATRDGPEGLKAFLEKRSPNFEDR